MKAITLSVNQLIVVATNAAREFGNRQMRGGRRTTWNQADYNAACRERARILRGLGLGDEIGIEKEMIQCTRCFGRGYLSVPRKPSHQNPNGLGFSARICPGCGGRGERAPKAKRKRLT